MKFQYVTCICNDEYETHLTLGAHYLVKDSWYNGDIFLIVNDKGNEHTYYSSHFAVVTGVNK